jgi:hypothetical protein
MKDEELKAEMRVFVEHEGSLKAGKVIGPVEKKSASTGKRIAVSGWIIAVEPTGLHLTVAADQIRDR